MEFAHLNKHGVYEGNQPGVECLEFEGKYSRADITLARTEDGYFYGCGADLFDKAMTFGGFGNPNCRCRKPLGMSRQECLDMAAGTIRERMEGHSRDNPKAKAEILAWLASLNFEQTTLFGTSEDSSADGKEATE